MSRTTARPTAAPTAVRTPAPEPRARFRDLLAAEWIKLWSLRSSSLAFGAGALIVLAINLSAAVADYTNWPTYNHGIRALFVPIWSMRDAFTTGAGMVLILATGSIGALTVVSEYSTGQIRTTFAAVPARGSVIAAKAAVVTAVMLVYGTAVAGTSFGATQAILSGRGIGLSLDHPGVLRAVAASALLAPVCALIGMGLGALIRHTAATVVTYTGILLLLPFLLNDRHRWSSALLHALPRTAWERLVQMGDPFGSSPYPATIGGSWLVYAAWPLAAAAVAVVAVRRRDV
ncbi:ABC transporter permease [Streptomyces sp. NRRL F-4489]|uniref:ABC transporter permease n=1 Tax=Streptomyces sp. NRRL F-4489 TaxID=1609095 RepID=UPI0007471C14|nr:ABC transporter permease [Streptomyces sp. NRRL F-4489]KUL43833.1 ABC transporter permease [Streptomyces sp. NRRL F-4489]